MMVLEGWREGSTYGETVKGPLRFGEGRTIGAALTWDVVKMMAAEVWDCREKSAALLVQIVYLNFAVTQGVPTNPHWPPQDLCPVSRMLLTACAVSLDGERPSVRKQTNKQQKKKEIKLTKQNLNTFHYSWWWSVETKALVLIFGRTPKSKVHQQQDMMTLNSEQMGYSGGWVLSNSTSWVIFWG